MKSLKLDFDITLLRDEPHVLTSFQNKLEEILSFKDAISRISFSLNNFEDRLDVARAANEFIDKKKAMVVFVTASALLRLCQKAPLEKHVPFSLAAIAYFIEAQDGQDDFEDLDGFEDDSKVLTLVIQHFNLSKEIENEVIEMKSTKENQSA